MKDDKARYYIGTCAWSYDSWKGCFYPPSLKSADFLVWYSRFFNTVEIDSTYHAVPSPSMVRAWRTKTPRDFRFTCKVPKTISHFARLENCAADMKSFLSVMSSLEDKLAAILLQLPPSYTLREEHGFKKFILAWPREIPLAVEFRHDSWQPGRVNHFLEDHGVGRVWEDYTGPNAVEFAAFGLQAQTSQDIYIRFMGDMKTKYDKQGKEVFQYGTMLWPKDSALENWTIKLKKTATHARRIHCYFNNHYEGFAIESATRLKKLLGLYPLDYKKALAEGSQMNLPGT